MAEVVEQPDLLLAEAPHGIVLGQAVDQLAHARAQLEGEVRRRRPDEGLDVVDGRVGHRGAKPNVEAAICAVVLVGETIDVVQILGGLLIGVGILAARRRSPVSPGE